MQGRGARKAAGVVGPRRPGRRLLLFLPLLLLALLPVKAETSVDDNEVPEEVFQSLRVLVSSSHGRGLRFPER